MEIKNEFKIGNITFTEEDIPALEMALESLKRNKKKSKLEEKE